MKCFCFEAFVAVSRFCEMSVCVPLVSDSSLLFEGENCQLLFLYCLGLSKWGSVFCWELTKWLLAAEVGKVFLVFFKKLFLFWKPNNVEWIKSVVLCFKHALQSNVFVKWRLKLQQKQQTCKFLIKLVKLYYARTKNWIPLDFNNKL